MTVLVGLTVGLRCSKKHRRFEKPGKTRTMDTSGERCEQFAKI